MGRAPMNMMRTPAPTAAAKNKEVAQQWRAAGVPVFPCSANVRKPLVQGWRTPARSGEDWSYHWNGADPCLIGIDCESMDLAVIDCDDKGGRNGVANFHSICQQEGVDLAEVPYVLTPSGGRHYIFSQPTGERIR